VPDDAFSAPLLTVAESSGHERTSLHADVIAFIDELQSRCAAAGVTTMDVQAMGQTPEGRELPVLVLSADGRFTPEAAHEAADAEGRPVVLILCNIHAGEVEGKEAALMLARDVTLGEQGRLAAGATAVIVPNFNADGNDLISTENRVIDLNLMDGQEGPAEGVGTRYTGQGLNLNRDYTKMEAPETRLLSALFGKWNPHVFVDSHTSNGSPHAYALTYDTAHTLLSGPPEPILYTRDRLLPAIEQGLLHRTGLRTWFYGNFRDNDDPTQGWETYPGLPRYGSHYRGLTGRLDILLEAYSYLPFEERIRATYEIFVEILDQTASRGREIVDVCARAAADTVARGRAPQPDDVVGINYGVPRRTPEGALLYDYPCYPLWNTEIAAWSADEMRARKLTDGTLTFWECDFFARFLPEVSVRRPRAYAFPGAREDVAEFLRGHNIEVVRAKDADAAFRGELRVECYVVLQRETTHSPDVGYEHRVETVLHVRRETAEITIEPDDFVVTMAQPLAYLAIYLLEPQSDDGLARWGHFDDVGPGLIFPVVRIPGADLLRPPPRRKVE
jgi:hypothetical protein